MSAVPEDRNLLPSRGAEPWYVPIVEFATHTIVGTAIFLLITSAAWIIHVATAAMGKESLLLHYGLRIVETTLFLADVLLFLVFIGRTTWRTFRKLVKG